jgi:cytochrome c oxidase subunit III
MQTTQPTLDVSHLPENAFDARAPLWWGNLLMIFIETATVLILLTSYYYVRRNYDVWPPPRPEYPALLDTRPDLGAATLNTVLLVGSCLPMYLTDLAARAKRRWPTTAGLAILFLISGISSWVRFYEFPAIKFSWGDNAYASIVWTMLGLHLIYIITGAMEFLIMIAWLMTHDIDDKHALDVTLAGGYWYWVAGIWVLIYVTIYFAPRFF